MQEISASTFICVMHLNNNADAAHEGGTGIPVRYKDEDHADDKVIEAIIIQEDT